jgi:arsenate reductase
MQAKKAIGALGALAHEHRLAIFRLLVERGPEGLAAGQIAERVGLAPSSLTFHLQSLQRAGLIARKRASRQLVYSAHFAAMNALVGYLTDNCCAGGIECAPGCSPARPERIHHVLFLCTGNSARSILAESLLNHLGGGRFRAFSAGSFPTGQVHPLALKLLRRMGLPTAGLRSKSWDEFAVPGAPPLDYIVTVCDNAAGEVCPIWPGRPATAHWGIADPAAAQGTPVEKTLAFRTALRELETRVRAFVGAKA